MYDIISFILLSRNKLILIHIWIYSRLGSVDSGVKLQQTESVTIPYPYHSPVNPTGISTFQPTGHGAFKTMPVSPKVML